MKPTPPPDDKLLNIFQRALDVNHAIYGLGIDVLAAYSPLLATLIPAYLTYKNTTEHLGFDNWIGFASAAAVEVLGISAVHTAVSLYQYNNSLTRKTDQRSPFWLAFFTALFYITIVLVVNVGLDAANGNPLVNVIASGTLSLLSMVGALIIAVRSQHALRITGNDPVTVQKQTDTERDLREKLRDLTDQLKQANKLNADMNNQLTQANTTIENLHTANRRLNEHTDELNTANEKLTSEYQRLNTANQRLTETVNNLNIYRTIFSTEQDTAERVHAAHRTFPDASQNALSQILNIPKATLNAHWPQNGHHRTATEQE